MTTPKEYRAEIMKTGGFGLMVPIGTFIISLATTDIDIFCLKTLIYLIFFGGLFYIGVIFIRRGFEVTEGKN
jgi:hypothetical protein